MQQPTSTTDTKGLKVITPEVTWAQRSSTADAERNHIFLTIAVPDVDPNQIKLDVQPASLNFEGYSQSKKATYAVKFDLYGEIDPKESKINHTPRDIEMVLRKKELKEEYWPRLLKEKAKVHYLKTDFDKWVDQDEQDTVPEDDDYMNRMGQMGGMGAGDGGFGGIDFSKLGGGMDDLSGLQGMAGGAGEEGDDNDEEMPDLEGEEKEDTTSKITELE